MKRLQCFGNPVHVTGYWKIPFTKIGGSINTAKSLFSVFRVRVMSTFASAEISLGLS